MEDIRYIAGGVAGAVALNILHESAKRLVPQAPRIDLVGEEALAKAVGMTGAEPPKGQKLFAATLGADLISNAMYFSAIGLGNKKDIFLRGAGYGLAAGIGAIALTKPLGLDDSPIAETTKTKVMTVAWYLFGGLVTALTIKVLTK